MLRLLLDVWIFLQELYYFACDRVIHFLFGLWYGNVAKAVLPPVDSSLLLEPATCLAVNIRLGKVKSVDVVKAYIKRIRQVQPMLNTIVDERFQDAVAEAEDIDRKIKSGTMDPQFLSKPFLGVPFTAKNSVGIEDCVQDWGSWYLKDRKAKEDAKVVELLREAGAIPVATSNVPEMCMSADCDNRVYGRTNNPYDTNRIPGGSSGGEAALLASAASVIGVGTDLGGSVRIPASCCGIFAHKPTAGIVSLDGIDPKLPDALAEMNTAGPMVRYVDDLLPMLKAMAGRQNSDRLRLDVEVTLKKVRLHYIPDDGAKFISRVRPEVTSTVHKVVAYLEEATGSKSRRLSLPEMQHAFMIWMAKSSHCPPIAVSFKAGKGRLRPAKEFLLTALGRSKHNLASVMFAYRENRRYFKAKRRIQKYEAKSRSISEKLEDILRDDGVLIIPANSAPAPYHHEWLTRLGYFINFTCLFNALGMPVTAVPVATSKEGLPIAVQVVASKNQDRLCVAVAKELAKGFGGWKMPSTQ
ncbi:fatty-acid amide hydrolase 2-like [Ornithodoros turicata]|uniref:fatty-acid amide hydrolase 2-like n=1 Tax=Ornithodoros turicata TaxID=34597 RepID=UPI00313890AF